MDNGDLLLLAVADVTDDGQRLEGIGVRPTIKVPFDPLYSRQGHAAGSCGTSALREDQGIAYHHGFLLDASIRAEEKECGFSSARVPQRYFCNPGQNVRERNRCCLKCVAVIAIVNLFYNLSSLRRRAPVASIWPWIP
jgi:hypothetical protein